MNDDPLIQIITAASADPADVIEAAAANIERYPDLHNQHTWRNTCGTGGCLAGWMVEAHPEVKWASSGAPSFVVAVTSDRHQWSENWAAELLGLPITHDADQYDGVIGSWELFDSDLNHPTVLARARAYAAALREGKTPIEAARLLADIYIDD